MVLVTMQRVERLWRKLHNAGRVVDAANVFSILLKTAKTECLTPREAALIDELEIGTPCQQWNSMKHNKRQYAAA